MELNLDLKLIGHNIKVYRKLQKLTQAQLAEKTNLSNVHIAHLESGNSKMSLGTLIKLCNALEVTPNDILDGIYTIDTLNTNEDFVSESPTINSINDQLTKSAKLMTPENKLLMVDIAKLLTKKQ